MKGVSPIMATVIIIALAVATGSFMAEWFSGMAVSVTQSGEGKVADSVRCSPATSSIKITSVFMRPGQNGTIRAVVENTGVEKGISVQNAFFYNRTGNSFPANNMPVNNLDPGQTAVLEFYPVVALICPADFDRLMVTTECPGIIASFDSIPKCELMA